jgi:type I restriction enzyme R subunit
MDFERFKAKARHFLRAHEDHVAIHKLRRGLPITESDISELERMLKEAAGGAEEHLTKVREQGLGLFVRSLVDLQTATRTELRGCSNRRRSANSLTC